MEEFERLLMSYGTYLGVESVEDAEVVFEIFLTYIYWHELTHHIVEDISVLKGNRWRVLILDDEKKLAEWHAFVTTERGTSLPPEVREAILLEGDIYLGQSTREKILSAIYYSLGRDRDSTYRPVVKKGVPQKLGALWIPVREASVRGLFVYPVNGEEVYSRLYLTTK